MNTENANQAPQAYQAPKYKSQTTARNVPVWVWGIGVLLLVALAFSSYRMVQGQQRLAQSEKEVMQAREATATAEAAKASLEKELATLKQSQTASEATIEKLKGEIADTNSRLEAAAADAEKQKNMAAELQQLVLQYKEQAERAATAPATQPTTTPATQPQ